MPARMYASPENSFLSNLNQNKDIQQSKGLRIYNIYSYTHVCVCVCISVS